MGKIKSLGKRIILKFLKAEDCQIEKLIRKADVVSFDIFDTLVKRCVKMPEDMHKIVAGKFYAETQVQLGEYQKYRMEAEKKARRQCIGEEVTLEEIFSHIENIPEIHKRRLRRIEEETEIEICCPCLEKKKIYQKTRKMKKHIILTSDMYLDADIIKKILRKCGYEHYEKLYLSSDYKLCKAKGSLYEAVKKDYPACRGKILHIGDNIKGDFLAAKRKGIRSCLIDGQKLNLKYWKLNKKTDFDYEKLFFYLNHHINSAYHEAERIGYEILGPMLLGYCMWLKEKMEKDGIEKIFFLSREGKILQKAFQALYPESDIEQCYLYVSRQSLVIPLIADTEDFDSMIAIVKTFLHIPILRTIRIVCSLEQEEFCRALSEIGMGEDTKIYEVPSDKKGAVFDIVQKLGKEQFEQQKALAKRYLKENGFTGKIAVADIGWSGTIQNALCQYAADTNTSVHGYYLGVRNGAEGTAYQKLYRAGYLFDIGKNETFDLMARFTLEVFEMLLLHQEGSVIGYGIKNELVVPILEKSEYKGKEGNFIDSVQNTALDLLRTIGKDSAFRNHLKVRPEYVMNAYARFAVYPKMNTIHMFEKFHFLDVSVKKLIPEHGIFYYMIHLKELKTDFENSFCKIFFLKKLFRLRLPYFKLLCFLAVKMNIQSNYRKKFYAQKKIIY